MSDAPEKISRAAMDILADADMAQAALVERAQGHVAAIERLAISASIASCTCLTKTPDITFHAADCRYVKLQYIIAQCEELRDLAPDAGVKDLEALRRLLKKCRPSVANMAYGWPEDDELVKEIDAALTAAEEAKG